MEAEDIQEWFNQYRYKNTYPVTKVKEFLDNLQLKDSYPNNRYIEGFLANGVLRDISVSNDILVCIHKYHRKNKHPGFYSDAIVDELITYRFTNFSVFEGWVPDNRVPELLARGVVPVNCVEGNEELFREEVVRLKAYALVELFGKLDIDTSEYYLEGLNIDFEVLNRSAKFLSRIIEYNYLVSEDIAIITESLDRFGKKSILSDRIISLPSVCNLLLYSNINFKIAKKSGLTEDEIVELIGNEPDLINKVSSVCMTKKVIEEFFKVKSKYFLFSTTLIKDIKSRGFEEEIAAINPIFINDRSIEIKEEHIADIADMDPYDFPVEVMYKIPKFMNYFEKYPILLKLAIRRKKEYGDDISNLLVSVGIHRIIPKEKWLEELMLEI